MEQYKEKQYICDVFKKLIEIKNKDVKINKNSSSKKPGQTKKWSKSK